MQRIIQINIAGRVLSIEEDAYLLLKDYLSALHRQFDAEDSRDEIIHDIENRIAELFQIRLQSGAPAIDSGDVNKVTDTLGSPSALGGQTMLPSTYVKQERTQNNFQNMNNSNNTDQTSSGYRRIFRNPNDKMIGGVCSGMANYFDIDPLIVRLIWGLSLALAGMGLIVYIIAWAIIPVAKTPQDFSYMTGGTPMTFHDVTRNVADELQDLKKRGEEMSRELKDFFSKKK